MAYEARLSDVHLPVIMGEDLQEGRPVQVSISGAVNDLPKAIKASSTQVHNVYAIMAAVDDFSRPTKAGWFTVGWNTTIDFDSGYADPIDSSVTSYRTGPSTLRNPTLKSGWRAVAVRGGTVAVPSGTFVMDANIKTPGAGVKVGSTNLWEYTATAGEIVATVDRYHDDTATLFLIIEQ
jgi:hypothetical protein